MLNIPDIRYDAKYYNRHLVAFYAGLAPVFVALLYASFYVQSFVWFVVFSIAGFLATFAITMCILPYPICASCGNTVRQHRAATSVGHSCRNRQVFVLLPGEQYSMGCRAKSARQWDGGDLWFGWHAFERDRRINGQSLVAAG